MEQTEMFERAVAQMGRLVEGVSEADLDQQTPCAEWKVRDMLHHLVSGSEMFGVIVNDGSIADDALGGLMSRPLPDDYKTAWREKSELAMDAFRQADGDKVVVTPFGEMPASVVKDILTFDVATHACDLARTTGQNVDDAEVVDTALELGKAMIGPDLRAPGLFDEAQPCDDGAPATERLLAFAGRKI
jgi:uncharacterized protein (TIGR03086 family)